MVSLEEFADDARALIAGGMLYDVAARNPTARHLQGRGVAYAIELPVSRRRVVVRHNRHGGLFRAVTRDVFLPPTRAPHELHVAQRLAMAGVRTPPLIMYGIERAAWLLRRSDVMTQEITDGRDLSSYLAPSESPAARASAWEATRELLRALSLAGARHHDLNVKNILLAPDRGVLAANVLDVDRVTFGRPDSESVRVGNLRRLQRSARKWRDERGAIVDERELVFG